MEQAEQTLARLVEERLKALNTNAFAFEKSANLPADAIRAILRGGKKSGTALNRAHQICEALGLELYIGPQRETGPIETVSADSAEFAHIPLHNAGLAAGSGIENQSEEVIDYLAFRLDWLQKIGVKPSNAVLARAHGDSMQPCIWHGDIVLIDTSKQEIPVRRPGNSRARSPVFAFLENGAARIKRIERPEDGHVMLLSDNPDYPPQLAKVETLSIIGKVLWWGHTNRE